MQLFNHLSDTYFEWFLCDDVNGSFHVFWNNCTCSPCVVAWQSRVHQLLVPTTNTLHHVKWKLAVVCHWRTKNRSNFTKNFLFRHSACKLYPPNQATFIQALSVSRYLNYVRLGTFLGETNYISVIRVISPLPLLYTSPFSVFLQKSRLQACRCFPPAKWNQVRVAS